MSHAVMWFRRDLRLEDNPAWAAACDSDSVTALYVLDPRLTGLSPRRTARLMSQLAVPSLMSHDLCCVFHRQPA